MQADLLFRELPLVAILRGLEPERAVEVATCLYEAGIRIVEVPLNSPRPFESLAALSRLSGHDWIIGAGTVLTVEDVRRTRDAGGSIVISPNADPEVIRAARELKLESMPGIATATEAFCALQAGARYLKLFPAITYGPGHLKALGAVLPADIGVFPVGGVGAADIPAWLAAGAAGFGFGSELFKPTFSIAEIARRARHLVTELREARRKLQLTSNHSANPKKGAVS
jgi:2-dehydro-3-deoxyphosphogalactonate aldolase